MFALIIAEATTTNLHDDKSLSLSLSESERMSERKKESIFVFALPKIARPIKQASLLSDGKRKIHTLRCRRQCNAFVDDLNGQTDSIFLLFFFFFFMYVCNVYKLFVVQTIFLDFDIVQCRIRI